MIYVDHLKGVDSYVPVCNDFLLSYTFHTTDSNGTVLFLYAYCHKYQLMPSVRSPVYFTGGFCVFYT